MERPSLRTIATLVVTLGVSLWIGHYLHRLITPSLDKVVSSAIQRANAYIVSQVGEIYFHSNYTLDRPATLANNRGINREIYEIRYRYKAFPDLGEVIVSVPKKRSQPVTGYVACVRNGEIQEPKVDKREALRIAEKAGIPTKKGRLTIDLLTPDNAGAVLPFGEYRKFDTKNFRDTWTWLITVEWWPYFPDKCEEKVRAIIINAIDRTYESSEWKSICEPVTPD